MSTKKTHRHRASLKQVNKKFKGSSEPKSKGRVEKKIKIQASTRALNKLDRRNQSKDKQAAKREMLQDLRRAFHGLDAAPKVVNVIPLSYNTNPDSFLQALVQALSLSSVANDTFYSEHFKQKIQCVVHSRDCDGVFDLFHVMDLCLVSDFTVFLFNGGSDCLIDEQGNALLKVLMNQGISQAVFCLQNLDKDFSAKDVNYLRQLAVDEARKIDPQVTKVYLAGSDKDLVDISRFIFSNYPKGVSWKQNYPHLIAESFQLVEGENGQSDLLVSGFCRGRAFNVQNCVHIPGLGDFALDSVEAESMTLTKESLASYQKPNKLADAEYFLNERIPVSMEDDEMQQLSDSQEGSDEMQKITVAAPRGTSSYQATWYADLDANSDAQMEDVGEEQSAEEEMEDVVVENRQSTVKFADLDEIEEKEQLEAFRQEKNAEQDDFLYPDEIDIPEGTSAASFLTGYRGVKNLRHVDWDPYEEVPDEYENIFHFQNFKLSQKKALAEETSTNISIGSQVILRISNVPQSKLEGYANKRLIVFGLLRHETNATVSHACLTRTPNFDGVLKSNSILVVSVGFRRYLTDVVFSEYNNHNAHKMLRYFQPGEKAVGSFYSSVGYPPCPVQMFIPAQDPSIPSTIERFPTLVATGSLLDPNPLRIIAERVTLTGCPFKVFKSTCVVRYMFFTPEDVNYYKPVELCTKGGRIGHIRESLGTHGYMKCVFDKSIQQNDKVYLHLYKRTFPRPLEDGLFHIL